MGKILSGENMRIFTTVLCFILFTSTISYGYEQVPDDAKVKTEDISKALIAKQAPEAKSRLGKNTIANLSGNGAEETNVVDKITRMFKRAIWKMQQKSKQKVNTDRVIELPQNTNIDIQLHEDEYNKLEKNTKEENNEVSEEELEDKFGEEFVEDIKKDDKKEEK